MYTAVHCLRTRGRPREAVSGGVGCFVVHWHCTTLLSIYAPVEGRVWGGHNGIIIVLYSQYSHNTIYCIIDIFAQACG
jgi:hypothetical protein